METLDRILGTTYCKQGFTQTLSNRDVQMIKFPPEYLLETVSEIETSQLRSLPARSREVLDSCCGVVFELVHAGTTVSHFRSHQTPSTSFQGENTNTPAGDISGDIWLVTAHCARA